MSRCMGNGDGDETVKIETVNIDSVKVQVRQKWSSGPEKLLTHVKLRQGCP